MKKALTPQEEEDKQNTALLEGMRKEIANLRHGYKLYKYEDEVELGPKEAALTYIELSEEFIPYLAHAAEYLEGLVAQIPHSVAAAAAVWAIASTARNRAVNLHTLMTCPVGALAKLSPGEDEPIDWAYIDYAEQLEPIRTRFANLPTIGMVGSMQPLEGPKNAFEAVNQILSAAKEIERNIDGCERQVHGHYSRFHFENFQASVLDQLWSLEID